MRKILRKLLMAPKIAVLWVRAQDATSKKSYEDALNLVEKIEKLSSSQPDVFILKGLLYYRLGKYGLSIKTMIKADNLVMSYKRYSDADKLYLKGFAAACCERAARKLGIEDQKIIPMDYREINLDKVKSHLKTNFPLRNLPSS